MSVTRRLVRIRDLASAVALVLVIVAASVAQGETYTEKVLYSFTGGGDGRYPFAGLARDPAGNLYGTTNLGGTYGQGTVFEVSATGGESVLYSFTGGTDGVGPYAGLVRDAAGNLYGTTFSGGTYDAGTVFEVSATGGESVLYSFAGGTDGATPYAGLVRDAAGNLYGTTYYGATPGCFSTCGIVFELSVDGTESVLHSFAGGADGGNPYAGLVQDAAGNLYGTTYYGGRFGCGGIGCGTVFEVSASGTESVLYSFTGGADGGGPVGGLVRDASGNLYGTTLGGGTYNAGTVFEVSVTGTESVLYSFTGGADGGGPAGGLVRDASGNLYGTSTYGGTFGAGTVFEISAGGTESVLYSFTGGADGDSPNAGVIRDTAGNLYGTTAFGGGGGVSSSGTVFELTPNGCHVKVSGVTQQQQKPGDCWATQGAIMASWRAGYMVTDLQLVKAADSVPPPTTKFLMEFEDPQKYPVDIPDYTNFLSRINIGDFVVGPIPAPCQIASMLTEFGPLTVVTGFIGPLIHAEVLVGVDSGGTESGSSVTLVDPDTGQEETESFFQFRAALDAGGGWPQFGHYPQKP